MPSLDGYYAPKSSTGGNWGGAIMGGSAAPPPAPNGGRTVVRSAPRTTISSRSGRYTSTGGTSSNVAPAAAVPAAPDLNTFLNQDSDYQNQLAQFANNLAQFMADATRRQGIIESDYGTSKKAMDDQKVIDLNNLEADYGSRGILRSGLYGKAVGDYNTEFNNRSTDLLNKEKQGLGALDQERSRYQTQNTLQQQQAREQAIRRRADQYGV